MSNIENAQKKAERINDQKDHLSTSNIEVTKATNGSLVLLLLMKNKLFKNDQIMEREVDHFVKCLFKTVDLKCCKNHQCTIILEIEDGKNVNVYVMF